MTTGDFRDPDWEPGEAEHAALMEDFRRVVLWRRAMAARGIKVLALGWSAQRQTTEMRRWWEVEGRRLDSEHRTRT